MSPALIREQASAFVRQAQYVIIVAVGYYAAASIGTLLSVPPSDFAIIWPATAVITAALILSPPRVWWTYLLGLIPTHFLLVGQLTAAHPPFAVALTQVLGNYILALATAETLRRVQGPRLRLDSLRDAVSFILVAGVAIPAAVNALILTLHLATGWTQDFGLAWRQWMLASLFPSITLTPLIVLGLQRGLATGDGRPPNAEVAILCMALFALSLLAFGGGVHAEYWPAMLLAPMPLLLWVAVRWGVGGACLSLIVFAGAIIARALNGSGPFATDAHIGSVLSIQVFLTALAGPMILLAALMEERRRTDALLRQSEARIELAAAATDTGLWQWEAATQRLWMTEHCQAMFGVEEGDEPSYEQLLATIHAQDRLKVRTVLNDVLNEGKRTASCEVRVARGGRDPRWYLFHVTAERDRDGDLVSVSGVFRDITERVTAQSQAEQLSQRLLTLQEEERKNISEELHNSTAQHLVALDLMVQAVRRRVPQEGVVGAMFEDIDTALNDASRELRTFTYLLRPPEVDRQGLSKALRQYVSGFARRTGVTTTLRLADDIDVLPLEHQRGLLRVAQEALANVYRHAGATRAQVSLRRDIAGALHLIVKDDGRGMGVEARQVSEDAIVLGVGIPGMTARMRQLGGKMVIRSSGKGTTLHAALPVAASAAVVDARSAAPRPPLLRADLVRARPARAQKLARRR